MPHPDTHQMCTAPNCCSKQRGAVVTYPHSGSDWVGLSPGFAGYELCDCGHVFSMPQFSHLQVGQQYLP